MRQIKTYESPALSVSILPKEMLLTGSEDTSFSFNTPFEEEINF